MPHKPIDPSKTRQGRLDQHLIAAHFETDVYREFKLLAASQLKGTKDMLNEAIADLFVKHNRNIPHSINSHLRRLDIK